MSTIRLKDPDEYFWGNSGVLQVYLKACNIKKCNAVCCSAREAFMQQAVMKTEKDKVDLCDGQ